MGREVAAKLGARARREQRGVGVAAHVGDGRWQRTPCAMVRLLTAARQLTTNGSTCGSCTRRRVTGGHGRSAVALRAQPLAEARCGLYQRAIL